MYLFTRTSRLAMGSLREGMAWATGITERVRQMTGLPVALHSRTYGEQLGTVVWSSFVPDLATLEAAGDKLLADDSYMETVEKAQSLVVSGPDDAVFQVIHGEPDPSREIEYVTSVAAVCANGQIAKGMALAVEIAERAEKITGVPTMVVASMTGPYGGLGWVTGHASIAEMEANQATLQGDPGWLEFIDKKAGSAYLADPSVTQQHLFRRIM